jgi:hypothetical protein
MDYICLLHPVSIYTHAFGYFSYLIKLHLIPPKINGLVKSPKTVMLDLIRHPEVIEFTGFRLSPK